MRVLILTKIFPSSIEPNSAPFNRQQFAALGKLCEVQVLATVPWFPFVHRSMNAVPAQEEIDGLAVRHPRTFYVPKWSGLSAALHAASIFPALRGLRDRFDVLLAAWAYPDGVAAVLLGSLLGLPTVVKLHGSDIDVLSERMAPRRQLRWALPTARRVVAVSQALADKAIALGAQSDHVVTVRNGVDTGRFFPGDRMEARKKLGIDAKRVILFVGRLEADKGIFELLAAHAERSRSDTETLLVLIGEGSVRAQVTETPSLRCLGALPLSEIPDWLAASDLLALPSYHEGLPNVILEALACGRPVVATSVGGIPELITAATLGELVPPKDARSLAQALSRVLSRAHDPSAIVAASNTRSWAQSAAELHRVLQEALA